MVRDIIHDPIFLAQKSTDADLPDTPVCDDLTDTLNANRERCVGLAANMIGISKRIIVFDEDGKTGEMFNPVILSYSDPFEAEEGCLSLSGTRKVKRYHKIKVRYQTRSMQTRVKTYTGFTAQIIQHEIDHTNGILI